MDGNMFMKKKWSTIRQTCILIFLILMLIKTSIDVQWLYYLMFPLILLCFVIDLFQYRGKSRAGKYRRVYLRLFDMALLIMYVAVISLLLIIMFDIN